MAYNRKLQELLQKLEKYNIFLYDNGTALYFMHVPTERKTRFFRNDSKNLTETLTEFCEKLLAKLEA